jgi:hypothetical protein
MASDNVTQIDATYLNGLKAEIDDLRTQVELQIKGLGTTGVTPDTTNYIPSVDNLTLLAGTTSFDAGTMISNALKTMGSSVHDRLVWLNQTLTDMSSEITTTISKFSGTESLNNDTVDQLTTDFQHTITDMGNPANTPNPNVPNPNVPNPNTTA